MKRADRGQSMVELALVLPFCLWVLLGIIDFGRVYYFYTAATNAAREGARYWAAHYDPSTCSATTCATAVKARVQAEANSTMSPGIDASLITLSIPASG